MPRTQIPETKSSRRPRLSNVEETVPDRSIEAGGPIGTGVIAHPTPRPSEVLWSYFLLTYLTLLLNTRGLLKSVAYTDAWLTAYSGAVQVAYTLLYLSPVVIFVVSVHRILHIRVLRRMSCVREIWIRRIVYALAIAGGALVQYLIFADKLVFEVFGFHLNGFVWNLVFTRGGIESMGAGSATTVLAVLAGFGMLVVQAGLLLLVWKVGSVRNVLVRTYRRKPIILGVCCVMVAGLYAQIGFGISALRSHGSTLAVANSFPCFVPTTFASIAVSLGYEVQRTPTMGVPTDAIDLRYPLQDIRRDPTVKPLNIVWFVSESLRADMLDPDIMPQAWELSEQSSRFEHHYSGGNGTRMGMFSMFYGLYGPYWFPFLAERRGPVLVDTLIDLHYQMGLFTSAMFTYPEFDRTLFSRIPSDQLHQGGMKPAWRQDQRHIDSLIRFIDQRDESRPFMTFLFFESPHANYSFSNSAIIRRPYAEDINYVSMNLERDIGLIWNRYVNSCHQVDLSIGKVLDYLSQHDLLDSTIVLITGDHGEEFMEKGRWGHNSEFTEEQTRVPFVLWVPGKPARVVRRITSHLDVPATILPLLGVLNPEQDYSLGHDLFGPESREFTVISSWNLVAYVGDDFKATFPTSAFAMFQDTVTTGDDRPVANPGEFYETHQQGIVEVMRGLKAFRK